jgi:hypothetical protein
MVGMIFLLAVVVGVAIETDGFFEFVEEGDLAGVDHRAGVGEGEPGSSVHFRERELFAGAAGPFQFKGVAHDGGGVEVAGGGPGKDSFSTLLADGTQGLEGAFERGARFFPELTDSGIQGRLFTGELPFRDGPDAGVLVLPEGAPGMDKKNFQVGSAPVKEDAGALLRCHTYSCHK